MCIFATSKMCTFYFSLWTKLGKNMVSCLGLKFCGNNNNNNFIICRAERQSDLVRAMKSFHVKTIWIQIWIILVAIIWETNSLECCSVKWNFIFGRYEWKTHHIRFTNEFDLPFSITILQRYKMSIWIKSLWMIKITYEN